MARPRRRKLEVVKPEEVAAHHHIWSLVRCSPTVEYTSSGSLDVPSGSLDVPPPDLGKKHERGCGAWKMGKREVLYPACIGERRC